MHQLPVLSRSFCTSLHCARLVIQFNLDVREIKAQVVPSHRWWCLLSHMHCTRGHEISLPCQKKQSLGSDLFESLHAQKCDTWSNYPHYFATGVIMVKLNSFYSVILHWKRIRSYRPWSIERKCCELSFLSSSSSDSLLQLLEAHSSDTPDCPCSLLPGIFFGFICCYFCVGQLVLHLLVHTHYSYINCFCQTSKNGSGLLDWYFNWLRLKVND